jgi:Gamma-glutamyl cyclotransferase, AIG2-like
MNPAILKEILALDLMPVTRPAKVQLFKLKRWGRYPALIGGTGDGEEVQGAAWKVRVEDHAERLAKYETRAYKIVACKILFVDGEQGGELSLSKETVVDGWTFVSSFPPERLTDIQRGGSPV